MAEFINCPACSAQISYAPDMVGLRINCKVCGHPFVVAAPVRGARMSIAAPPAAIAPIARIGAVEFGGVAVATPGIEDEPVIPFAPESREEPTTAPAQEAPVMVVSFRPAAPFPRARFRDMAPQRIAAAVPVLAPPEPVRERVIAKKARPLTPVSRPPRQWTKGDRALLQVGICVALLGGAGLILPATALQLPELDRLGGTVPMTAALLVVIGVVTCAVVTFRQFAKLVFLATSGVLALAIVALFAYATARSPGSSDAAAHPEPVAVMAVAQPTPKITGVSGSSAKPRAAKNPTTMVMMRPVYGYDAFVDRYGAKRVVRVTVQAGSSSRVDAGFASKAHEQLRPLAPSWFLDWRSDQLQCVLAPVDDLDGFVSKLAPFGTAVDVNKQERKVTLRMN